ncbi:hypothetical protein HanPSC8_Chr03g0097191 [Helianthus annuus]|nr:hypothetical protein HanPSC8_Chr03g0097191 [Helianthus annuus]
MEARHIRAYIACGSMVISPMSHKPSFDICMFDGCPMFMDLLRFYGVYASYLIVTTVYLLFDCFWTVKRIVVMGFALVFCCRLCIVYGLRWLDCLLYVAIEITSLASILLLQAVNILLVGSVLS